jgi:bifunctional non-homologous end joining protein LigD
MVTAKKKSAPKKAASAPKTASDLIDEQLARYRAMRDFHVTPEPSGSEDRNGTAPGQAVGEQFPFVVQKHRATRLHYDFRLGLHGVLKSWAITKGPSYVPADKRLAVQVEDHPMEYGGFEGTIPKGQYGGGTVMLWDEGTWEPVGDPDAGLAKGNLKFILHGKKLHGKWVLVRMGGRAAREEKPNWLLIKEHDEYERKPDDPSILDEAPDSAISGRSLDAIAGAEDHVWQSSRPETRSGGKRTITGSESARKEPEPFRPQDLPGKREKLPGFIPPLLAKESATVPDDKTWIHELKLDGYRIQAHLESGGSVSAVKLFSRNGLDWTHRMPSIAREIRRLPVEAAILDGEVVVLNSSGQTSFADLQAAFDENKPQALSYFVFDLLHLNGHNLRNLPLIERKRLLSELIQSLGENQIIRYSEHLEGNGQQMFTEACRLGAEGIISKLVSAPYSSGRGSSWIKIKCIREQEFVIGGFTQPSDGSHGIGALLLGYYEDGRLEYAGRTGTGFTRTSSRALRDRLEKLRTAKSPFAEVPVDGRRGAIWLKPTTVAQVQFRTWTADHRVRQASFKGIREDKAASEVRREEPDPALSKKPEQEQTKATRVPRRKLSEEANDASPASASTETAARRQTSTKAHRSAKSPGENRSAAIRVTHPDKVIDPKTGLTKQALVDYYLVVAENMLPHIAGRPLSLVRCPSGAGQHCFFQKHLGQGMPRGVEGVEIPHKKDKGSEIYVTLSTAEGLAGLAQMNVMEVHVWGSTNETLECPDRIIFDLDPDEGVNWKTLTEAAEEVHERLWQLGLKSFLKSTGGKGLHIVAPVRPEYEWDIVKSFAHAFSLQMEKDNPQLYISKMTKAARKNKIYVDYLRNDREATAIAPYSSRARPGVGAALPLQWSELKSPERPYFAVADFAQWQSRLRRDPWKELLTTEQRIPAELFQSSSG